jgi:hypothetical protein
VLNFSPALIVFWMRDDFFDDDFTSVRNIHSTARLEVTMPSAPMQSTFHVANMSVLLSPAHIIASLVHGNPSSMDGDMKICWLPV